MSTWKIAYEAGYQDGLAWDLEGFASADEVARDVDGWADATIQAIGVSAFRQRCGIDAELSEQEDADAFGLACRRYDRGAYAGATATSGRLGKGPGVRS